MVRAAVIGASHWHLDLFLPALLDSAEVVGVSDPSGDKARRIGERIGCAWSDSYEDLCTETKPDFVLALGEHADMDGEARYLLEHGIPFAMEKPCGLTAAGVHELAAWAATENAFAAVPFVWRQSELLREMRARFDDSAIDYLSFRWIAGPPSRYLDAGCEWMLDPARAGGGCTINLGVHLLDLAGVVLGSGTRVETAVMSNAAHGLSIEDYSLVVLRNGKRTMVAETGYLRPGPTSEFDMRFTIKAREHYLVATGPRDIEVLGPDGAERVRAFTTNVPHYPVFVRDVLHRLETGQPPLASMSDMAAAMDLVEDAYRIAGKGCR